MVKTRSQTGNITIKKEEEEEEDCKPSLRLGSIRNTRTSTRIAKRTPPITNNRPVSAQQVKLEEDTDTKSLLKSAPSSSKLLKGQQISQEQISQLIDYVVNDNMSLRKASRKVNICYQTGSIYCKLYKNDPEKKIPSPRNQFLHPRKICTQEQTGNLIKYINSDKMTIKEAAAKANMSRASGNRYYNKYMKDPNHAIPVPRFKQYYTQDQRNEFIGYIINDKMSIAAASEKAKMKKNTGQKYYHNYFKVENPDIARPSHIATHKFYTQEQIKKLINYIVDDKMSIAAASRKANMNRGTAGKYYQRYIKDNNMEIPVGKCKKRHTQEEIHEFIGYIVDDKMSVTKASKKANMCKSTGYIYYRAYLKDQKL